MIKTPKTTPKKKTMAFLENTSKKILATLKIVSVKKTPRLKVFLC